MLPSFASPPLFAANGLELKTCPSVSNPHRHSKISPRRKRTGSTWAPYPPSCRCVPHPPTVSIPGTIHAGWLMELFLFTVYAYTVDHQP